MRNYCPLIVVILLLLSTIVLAVPGEAQTRSLPRATFPTYARPARGNDSQLPQVNGLHLNPGENRRPGQGAEPYDPGEPSLNMALVRWDIRRFPLRIWISPGFKLQEAPFEVLKDTRVGLVTSMLKDMRTFDAMTVAPGWVPEMNEMVANGFEQWRELENEGVIAFGFVDHPRDANILVFFTDQFLGAAGPGGTNVHGLTTGRVFTTEQVVEKSRRGEGTMPIVMELMVNSDFAKLQAEAAHEFGHALGIKAHSPFREDIMYENRIVDTLSPADKATLRALYRQKPKFWYY